MLFKRKLRIATPGYKAYNNTQELIEDFLETRLDAIVDKNELPIIYIKLRGDKRNSKIMILTFEDKKVWTTIGHFPMEKLYLYFTYLDGTPVGKKE